MQTKKVINLFLILLLLVVSTSFFANKSSANGEQEDIIDSTFDLKFKTATSLYLNVTLDVKKITIGTGIKETYLKTEIEELWNNTEIPQDDRGAIRQKLGEDLTEQIDPLFIDTDYFKKTSMQTNPTYDKTDNKFHANFFINLSSNFFGLDNSINADKIITGLLDNEMGIILKYNFDLKAKPGWVNKFEFDLSDTEYVATEDAFSLLGGSTPGKTWERNNTNGDETISGTINLYVRSGDPTILYSEDVSLKHELSAGNPDKTMLITHITMKNISVEQYNFPDFVSYINIIPSDGIRLLIDNEILTWNQFNENTIEPIKYNIIKYIENSSLNQTLQLEFEWNRSTTDQCSQKQKYDINSMDHKPPIKSKFTDKEINLTVFNISSKAFFGLINAGAEADLVKEDINFGENLSKINTNYKVAFYLPKNFTINDLNPYIWNEKKPMQGKADSENKNNYTKEKKETIIEIDLQNPRLNVISFITGNTEIEFDAVVTENRKYYVTDISNQSEYFPIPKKISLDYLCADAFRLCVEENVFRDENISGFLQNEKNIFKQRTTGLWNSLKIGNEAKINKKTFEESINAEEINIFNMNEYPAIEVDSSAKIVKPIHFDMGFLPPSFKIEKQNFNIKNLEGQNVTYRIIFPNGIDVKVKNSLNKEVDIKKTKDGKTIIEFSFNSSEKNLSDLVKCELDASGLFILGMFLPCILTFIVALILVVALIFIRRKKGGGFRDLLPRRSKKDELEEDSYEDEEFYVPPPPEDKK